jgi:ketosteroid isomerase-like protein
VSLREVIERGDFEEVACVLDPDVVWVGVAPGQLCRNREQVLATFRRALEGGRRAAPEILAETEQLIVVDPHVEPPPELVPGLHQVFVLEEGRIVEMRDYPDRESALEAVRGA